MLKADLHVHAKGDPSDLYLKYAPEQWIDHAASLSFDVLCISCHGKVLFSKKLESYARKKGILLIPGAEAYIQGKHVLVYGISQSELESLKTFDDLRALKRKKDVLIIAPHPFYPRYDCLKEDFIKNVDVFDAVEICRLYIRFFDFNRKAVRLAKQYGKPLVALSDSHFLRQFGRMHTLVDSKNNVKSFFEAVRQGKTVPVHSPMGFMEFLKELLWAVGVINN